MNLPIKQEAKTKYIGCLVTPEEKEKLTQIANKHEISLAELIRFALKNLEDEYEQTTHKTPST
jgi:hypothetical protein